MDTQRRGGNVNVIEQLPQSLPPSTSSGTSFPILAISVVGILVTVILLLSYNIFVIKCCLNRHHSDVLRRLLRSQRRWNDIGDHMLSTFYLSTNIDRGLKESAIQAIPTLRFRRGEQQNSFHECAVCLNEFLEEERIRMLPNCFHVFHIDCIDIWLQTHENCPLCRAHITSTILFPVMHTNNNQVESVAIGVRDEGNDQTSWTEASSNNVNVTTGSSVGSSKGKLRKVSCFGDECIDLRGKDGQFAVQPMRRSFSMDSSSDRQLYTAVQEIPKQNPYFREAANGEGTSTGSGRTQRAFFTFSSHCRTSRTAIFSIHQNEK